MLPSNLVIVTAPTEPVSTGEMNTHLRLSTGHSEETYVDTLVTAARLYVEDRCRRTIPTATYDYYLNEFPADGKIELPRPPLQSITSIKYYDANNDIQTLDTSVYDTITWASFGYAILKSGQSWPTIYDKNGAVVIRYVAGQDTVDEYSKNIIKAVAAHLFEHRDHSPDTMGSVQWPDTIERMINIISLREIP